MNTVIMTINKPNIIEFYDKDDNLLEAPNSSNTSKDAKVESNLVGEDNEEFMEEIKDNFEDEEYNKFLSDVKTLTENNDLFIKRYMDVNGINNN